MNNFLKIEKDKILYQNDDFFIIKDSFPVSPGHLLVISNELRLDYFSLSKKEMNDLSLCIEKAKEIIESEFSPDGYNIGMNCGEAAGQTIMHFHCHVIPRYKDDMSDPRGGVRHVIKGKGYY